MKQNPSLTPPSTQPTQPMQGALNQNNDLSKTETTRGVIEAMVAGINRHEIDTMHKYFDEAFSWKGNAGCGVKRGLKAFQDGWQRPFQLAFSEKVATDAVRIAEGEWAAAFGSQQARHTGTFMGIAPTGKAVEIRYMDFWHVRDGKIVDNWVMVDFPHVMRQLGVDPFNGRGWDAYGAGYDGQHERPSSSTK